MPKVRQRPSPSHYRKPHVFSCPLIHTRAIPADGQLKMMGLTREGGQIVKRKRVKVEKHD